MEIKLTHRRALITGGNSGIGKAIGLALGAAGARVAVNYLKDQEAAKTVVGQIRETGGQGMAVQADISQFRQVADMFRTLDDAWGGLDILINNAGIQGRRAFAWEADLEEWRKVVEVNLLGTFQCSQAALQRMIPKESGVILNITSVHERIPWGGYSAYAASKSALAMLTQTLSLEAAPHGIRVVSLAPGAVQTAINRSVWSDEAQLADLREKIPLDRIGQPEEIARTALFLVSDAASYITGSTVFADGGMIDYPGFAEGG
mgnify:CR=1 FL=1